MGLCKWSRLVIKAAETVSADLERTNPRISFATASAGCRGIPISDGNYTGFLTATAMCGHLQDHVITQCATARAWKDPLQPN